MSTSSKISKAVARTDRDMIAIAAVHQELIELLARTRSARDRARLKAEAHHTMTYLERRIEARRRG